MNDIYRDGFKNQLTPFVEKEYGGKSWFVGFVFGSNKRTTYKLYFGF